MGAVIGGVIVDDNVVINIILIFRLLSISCKFINQNLCCQFSPGYLNAMKLGVTIIVPMLHSVPLDFARWLGALYQLHLEFIRL